MNPQWLLIRRLRGPAYLLTFGVTALLHQWDILGFSQSWPLYLIVAGLLTLAERAALASGPNIPPNGPYDPAYGASPYGVGQPYGGQYGPPSGVPYPAPSQTPYTTTAVVPVPPAGLQSNDPTKTGRS
jgi:hypothetical protein